MNHPFPDGPRQARGLGTHTQRAAPHAIRALCLAGLLGACGAEPAARVPGELEELYDAWTPVPPTATSDHHDAALHRRREVLERLRAGDRELGLAALEAFRAGGSGEDHARDLKLALLEVAAHCAPHDALPDLERLVLEYGADLGLRAHAAELLGRTSPGRAVELFDPILREPRHSQTYPPRETMLRAWITACEATGAPMDGLLAEVATNLFQPQEVRYLAIESLASTPTPRAVQALEEVLVESSSDAFIRRKAAQAIRDGLPREEACAILERIAERESDEAFIYFLADMLDRHCP